jgi:hypothetical protein
MKISKEMIVKTRFVSSTADDVEQIGPIILAICCIW